METDIIIKFEDFYWQYKASKELNLENINLEVKKGEFLGIMGATGAGKSTLCMCMNGLIPLKTRGWIKGSVEVLGKKTRDSKMTDLGINVGLIFQDPETQFIMMNVEDEIALGLETLGLTRKEIKQRIQWGLNLVGLDGFENRTPEELSGGQKQRVAIASIMAMRPEILILDEPTSDLDPKGKTEIFEVLDRIREKFNMTIILVSHETRKIVEFCSRVIIIDEGKIVFDEEPNKLLEEDVLLKKTGIFNPFEFQHKALSNELKGKGKVLIDASNISYSYPDNTEAIKNIDLQIFQGDLVAIIGKNGSGKTTLIKTLNRLLIPQKGEIKLKEKQISSYKTKEIAQFIGYCYQNPDYQLFKNTIQEEMEYGLKNLNFPKEIIQKRYEETSTLLGLKKFEEIYKSTIYLSKGIRQRLALASVLVLEPEIIIIDEPTTGQDYRMIEEFMKIIKKLHENGHTIIIITHDPYIIANYTREVIILDGGQLIERVPTSQFLEDERLQQISSFIPP